jgi:hypothetical protein
MGSGFPATPEDDGLSSLERLREFEIDHSIDDKLLISVARRVPQADALR